MDQNVIDLLQNKMEIIAFNEEQNLSLVDQ